MRFQYLLALSVTLYALISGAPAAKADVISLTDPQYATEYYANLTSSGVTTTTNYTGGDFQINCAPLYAPNVCGTISLNTAPITSVSSTTTAYKGVQSTSLAEIAYYYEIVQPGPAQSNTKGNILIPLQLSAYVSLTYSIGPGTSIGGVQQNFATVRAIGSNGQVVTDFSSPQVAPSSYILNFNAYAYDPQPIFLTVITSLYNSNDNTPSSVTGFVDPILSFAPGFDSTGYALAFSPSITNGQDVGSTAPEPATFGLMAGAAALLLFTRRNFTRPRGMA